MMRSRILIGLIAGTIGGLLGAFLQEATINHGEIMQQTLQLGQPSHLLQNDQTRKLALFVGGLIGLFLGAVNGVVEGNSKRVAQGMGIGFLTGTIMGYMGLFFGSTLYNFLGGGEGGGMLSFARQVVARAFGWSLLGLGIGIGAGLSTRSPKRIIHGAIGGLLGGFVGGFIFDLAAVLIANPVRQGMSSEGGTLEVGGPSRVIGFTAIGALTGFFIGLVEELLKQAWVRVLAGRNEGKDFILDKPMSILGRDERCDVPLFGDPSVGIQHAAIRAENRRHVLIDAGTPVGTFVNGQRVPTQGEIPLSDGDTVQIGKHQIQFREKDTANKAVRRHNDVARPTPISIPMDAAGSPIAPGYGTVNPPLMNNSSSGGSGYPMATGSAMHAAPNPYGTPATYGGELEMPRLVGMEGPYTGQIFLLTAAAATVGREPDRNVVLGADSSISRNHARFSNENGVFIVYDNNSANGTFVNGMRVAMQQLAPGDTVQFGSSKFRFE